MKFKKEFLIELEDEYNVDIISEDIIDQSRWSTHYRTVFKFENKYYETFYSVGSTEYQDESPYEYEPDEIELDEVFPVEKIITVYERKK